MSGHATWATIKHKNGALDATRGTIVTRLITDNSTDAQTGRAATTNPHPRGHHTDAQAA